jgi:hypothetical protein
VHALKRSLEMTHLPGEEWLSKQEPVLRGWLSKAILSFVAISGPLLLILSKAPTLLKLAGSAIWVLAMLLLWLLSWLAIYRTKVRELKSEMEALSNKTQKVSRQVSDLECSLLELMYDYYPERYTREELEEKTRSVRVEIDLSLMNLLKGNVPLITRPSGGLWHNGGPNPKGFGLTASGMAFVKNRRSEQAAPSNPQ